MRPNWKSCLTGSKKWALMVLFLFCVLESKFKNIPSKRQNNHCEWIFRLVWFPQNWQFMSESMARNSNKIYHVNTNASSKDSASLSFFRLEKNHGPREYDTKQNVFKLSTKTIK